MLRLFGARFQAKTTTSQSYAQLIESTLIQIVTNSSKPVSVGSAADLVLSNLAPSERERLEVCGDAVFPQERKGVEDDGPAAAAAAGGISGKEGSSRKGNAARRAVDVVIRDCIARHPALEALASGNLCYPNLTRVLTLTQGQGAVGSASNTGRIPAYLQKSDLVMNRDRSSHARPPPSYQQAVCILVELSRQMVTNELVHELYYLQVKGGGAPRRISYAAAYKHFLKLLFDGHFHESPLELWHSASQLSFFRLHQMSKLCARPLLHGFIPLPMTIRSVRELLQWDTPNCSNCLRKQFGNVLHCLDVLCGAGAAAFNQRLKRDVIVQQRLSKVVGLHSALPTEGSEPPDDSSKEKASPSYLEEIDDSLVASNYEATCRFFSNDESLVSPSGALLLKPHDANVPVAVSETASLMPLALQEKFIRAEHEIFVFSSSLATLRNIVLPILTPIYMHFTQVLHKNSLPIAEACHALVWSHHLGEVTAAKFFMEYVSMFPEFVQVVPLDAKRHHRDHREAAATSFGIILVS